MMAAAGTPAQSQPEVGNDGVLVGAREGAAAAAIRGGGGGDGAGGGGGDETETDGLEDDEDEDEGWDSGGGAAVVGSVGGRLVEAPNGGSAMGRTSGSGFGELSALKVCSFSGLASVVSLCGQIRFLSIVDMYDRWGCTPLMALLG